MAPSKPRPRQRVPIAVPRVQDPSTVFSRRLREARLKAGLSQKALGIRAEFDPFVASTRINRYKQGVHVPDPVTTAKLAQALDYQWRASTHAHNDRLARMIRAFDKLGTAEQEKLLKVAKA